MAQLALAAAGAAVGFAIGGPAGASIGWALGGTAGSLLFPPKGPNSQGPRLSDLASQGSAYGAGIPIVYGTCRVGGVKVWSTGLIERSATTRRGGKGGGRSKSTTFSYYASWATLLCRGEVDEIRRIWFDDKLVWDSSGASVEISIPGLVWRWYPGDEDQLPDPLYEDAVGADNAVAHRGYCYLVFDNVPLDRVGNREPNVSVEVVMSADPGLITDSALDTASHSYLVGTAQWERAKFYTVGSDRVLREHDANTLETRAVATIPMAPRSIVTAGDYVVALINSGNNAPAYRININTGEIRQFGVSDSSLDNTTTKFTSVIGRGSGTVTVYTDVGPRHFLLTVPFFGAPYCLDIDGWSYIFGANGTLSPLPSSTPGGGRFLETERRPGETDVFYFVTSGSDIQVHVLTFTSATGNLTGEPLGIIYRRNPDITAASIGTTGSLNDEFFFFGYDQTDGTIILCGADRIAKMATNGTILWSVAAAVSGGAEQGVHQIRGTTFAVIESSTIALYSTQDGALINSYTMPSPSNAAGFRHYDSDRLALFVGRDSTAAPQRFLLNRSDALTVTLASIVTDLCAGAGLAAGDIDVTDLTQPVRGYVVSRPMPRRSAIEELASAFLFDAVESDDVLRFVNRGGAAVATIDYDDMLRDGSEGVVVEDRTQELELPRALTLRHFDPDRGYETNAQQWRRPAAPTATALSQGETVVDLPVVLAVGDAKATARRLLTALWRERTRLSFGGTTQHLRIEPTDVVTVTLADGSAQRVRIISAQLGADWSMRFEAVAEAAADYALTADADGGAGYPDDVIPSGRPIRIFLPVLPLLTDEDDLQQRFLRSYIFVARYDETGEWPGAVVWRVKPEDNPKFLNTNGETPHGTLTEWLHPPSTYWTWDDVGEITVRMAVGADQVVSAADLDVLNGANVGVLVSQDGRAEVVQHATVTDNGDGTITLSRLLRGRRGSEHAGTFSPGTIYLLCEPDPRRDSRAVSTLGDQEIYAALTPYISEDRAPQASRIVSGQAEKPYAPTHLSVARDGSDNITLSWVRRTRVFGEWRNFTGDVPVSEAAEDYEVDVFAGVLIGASVYSASAGTVARLFDADGATSWQPGLPSWAVVQFANAVAVAEYRVQAAASGASSTAPSDWTFEGSDDGVNWWQLDSQASVTSWTDGEVKTYAVAAPKSFRRYRLSVTGYVGGGTFSIAALEMAVEAGGTDIAAASYPVAVLRTIDSLTSPSASYTAAEQTTDGLTPGDPVTFAIYQRSAIVGRGIPGVITA